MSKVISKSFMLFSCPEVGSIWSVYDDGSITRKKRREHVTIVRSLVPFDLVGGPDGFYKQHGFLLHWTGKPSLKTEDAEQFVVIFNGDETIALADDNGRSSYHRVPTVLLSEGRMGLLIIDKRLCHRIA